MTVAYAASTDVASALRRALTTGESTYVAAVIAEAQDMVAAYLGRTGTTYAYATTGDVPGAVTRVTARMVARVFQQAAQGAQVGVSQVQQTTGSQTLGTSFVAGATSGSPWLASSDKVTLRPYRVGGGMASVPFVSERFATT